jgi:hypothetical protein
MLLLFSVQRQLEKYHYPLLVNPKLRRITRFEKK